ncbi:MAG: zinc ribbon domain-containing protein [Candidatus Freyarchaeota archaeon]
MGEFEIVVPSLADMYDEFLEFFDRQIGFSSLKRFARLGRASWNFGGGFLSKGGLQVYLRGNDICCRVNTEIEILPIIILIIFVTLLGLIFLVVALDSQKKMEREVRRAIENTRAHILASASKKPVKIPVTVQERLIDCPGCGEALREDANFCPYCGFKLEKCIVCNFRLSKGKILKCPYCSGQAHRDHLLEYVKVKGQCPSCGKELKEYDLV